MKPRAVGAAALVLLATVAWGQYRVPARPTRYATDLAGVTDAARLSALNEQLAAFERQTSNQVLVYVDRKLPAAMTIEEFASEAFKAWGVGQKDKDNGVVLFVFVDDRKMRIEVGYGLEGAITDARAGLIVDSVLAPRFRQRDFTGGIEAAAQEVMSAARGEPFRGTGRTVAEAPIGGFRGVLAWGLPALLGLVAGFIVYRTTGRLHWTGLGGLATSSVFWIFMGTPIANDPRPMILGFGLLLLGATVAVPVMIGKSLPVTRKEMGRQSVGVILLQAGAGLLLLSLVLFIFSALGLHLTGLGAKALLAGPLLLALGGLLHSKDPWEIVTLGVGRIAFLAMGVSGAYLGMMTLTETTNAPIPGRQGAIDVAVIAGLVFVIAWIVAHSQGWKMGPTGLGTGGSSGSWGFSSGGSGWSSGGGSSGGGSSWSSSSSSSFSGGGGSSGGGGASGSW
jgi:uncharacterized protein